MKDVDLVFLMAASALMFACTDYRTEINEAHDEYVKAHSGNDDGPFLTECTCDVDSSHMNVLNGSLFYDPVLSGPTISYYVTGCARKTTSVVGAEYNFVPGLVTGSVVYDMGGIYKIDASLDLGVYSAFSQSGGVYDVPVIMGADSYVDGDLSYYAECPRVYLASTSTSQTTPSESNAFSSIADKFSCDGTELWCKNTSYHALTGYEDGGYWWTYTDEGSDGLSSLMWPVGVDRYNFEPLINYCKGFCGSYALDVGGMEFSPFVGVVISLTSNTDMAEAADVSDWGGLCVSYMSTYSMEVLLGFGSKNDEDLFNYDVPRATFGKTDVNGKTECIPWSKFKQVGWGGAATITGPEASHKLVNIKFEFQGQTGSFGDFNIIRITKYTDR